MAHLRYVAALEEAKKTQVGNEKEKKRKMIDEESVQIKHRKMDIVSCINILNKDIDKCCKDAAEKHEISLVLKSNDMRVAVKEKESLLEDLDSAIENLEKDKKKAGK